MRAQALAAFVAQDDEGGGVAQGRQDVVGDVEAAVWGDDVDLVFLVTLREIRLVEQEVALQLCRDLDGGGLEAARALRGAHGAHLALEQDGLAGVGEHGAVVPPGRCLQDHAADLVRCLVEHAAEPADAAELGQLRIYGLLKGLHVSPFPAVGGASLRSRCSGGRGSA